MRIVHRLAIPGVLIAANAFSQTPSAPPLDAIRQTRLDADLRCLLGVYALPSARFVTITGDNGERRGLQYTFSNGETGVLREAADGSHQGGGFTFRFESCKARALKMTRDGAFEKTARGGAFEKTARGGAFEEGSRVRLIERETTFTSDGVALHGKLVLPASGRAESAAVWVDGSNNDPSTDDAVWQYELARRGIAVFTYDKRGTGASAGAPTSDFHARARDTVAAAKEVRRLAPAIRRVGAIGGSQGGWVAPLAATLAPLDFVVAAFAMAEGPIAQDRELVEQQLREAGAGGAAMLEAKELTSITERIVRSNMRDGLSDLDSFKSRHAGVTWLKAIQPRSYTGLFLLFSSEDIRTKGPALAQGLTFDYEPRVAIESIRSRQLWLLGGSDRQAPNAGTQAILKEVQQKRRDLAVVVFPNADHGLVERKQNTTRYTAKLFDVTADWIQRRKLPAQGNFIEMAK